MCWEDREKEGEEKVEEDAGRLHPTCPAQSKYVSKGMVGAKPCARLPVEAESQSQTFLSQSFSQNFLSQALSHRPPATALPSLTQVGPQSDSHSTDLKLTPGSVSLVPSGDVESSKKKR